MNSYPYPPFKTNLQARPGTTEDMSPKPDHGEDSYNGSSKLVGRRALITGGDSGIGRAVALAFAREGADVAIAYLSEEEDAMVTQKLVECEGRKFFSKKCDVQFESACNELIDDTVLSLGGLDILVNNAAYQSSVNNLNEMSSVEWELTFRVNVHAIFYLTRAALPFLKSGSAIINTASINSDMPNPSLLAYAATKGAIQNLTGGLAQLLAKDGIRVNAVAPGPVWTPLIPSTLPQDAVANFGNQVPLKRPAQPAELATAYVMLADPLSSFTSGAIVAVTGGKPFL